MLRKTVFEQQQKRNKRTMIVDPSLFLYADSINQKIIYDMDMMEFFLTQQSIVGIIRIPQRWEVIKKDLGIDLNPWRLGGGKYILVCCQRDGGWSMDGLKVNVWLQHVIEQIRKFTKREIRIRFSP